MARPRPSARLRSHQLIRSEKANNSVAKPRSKGTICAKARSGVSTRQTAPLPAPIIDAKIRLTKARSNGGNCERSDSAASIVPGMTDARLDTAARCGGTPVAISAG
jgi:hypothetical protein